MEIRNILRATLESAESSLPPTTIESAIEAIEEAETSAGGGEDSLPSIVDILDSHKEAQVFENSLISLNEHAKAVEDKVSEGATEEVVEVAQECLAQSLRLLLSTQKQVTQVATFESSASPAQKLQGVRKQIDDLQKNFSKNLQASLESKYDDNHKAMVWLRKENTTLQGAIKKAISAIKSNKGKLDDNPIQISHKGIYFFLRRDGKSVHDLKHEIDQELAFIERVVQAEKVCSDFYLKLVAQIRKIGTTGKITDLQGLFHELSNFDTVELIQDIVKYKPLFSGSLWIYKNEDDVYDEDDDVWYTIDGNNVLAYQYKIAEGDNSKASVGERVKATLKGASGGALLGGLLTGFLTIGLGAITAPVVLGSTAIGGAIVGAAGGAAGYKSANHRASGANTSTQISSDDLISFLESCAKAVDIQEKSIGYDDRVFAASKKVKDSLDLFIRLIEKSSTSQQIVINTGKGSVDLSQDDAGSISDMVEAIRKQIETVYEMHMSIAEFLHIHSFWIARGGLMMAKVVLDELNKAK